MQCLILHIPHSSSFVPKSAGYIVEDAIIQNEILELTDWYTDELFSTKTDTVICAPFSRVFCDVERFSNDDE